LAFGLKKTILPNTQFGLKQLVAKHPQEEPLRSITAKPKIDANLM